MSGVGVKITYGFKISRQKKNWPNYRNLHSLVLTLRQHPREAAHNYKLSSGECLCRHVKFLHRRWQAIRTGKIGRVRGTDVTTFSP